MKRSRRETDPPRKPGGRKPFRRSAWAALGVAAVAAALGAFLLLRGPATNAPSPFCFVDATDRTGVTFRHFDGSTGKHHIVETYASGLAVLDYDNDGDEDIYFLNGAPLDGPPPDPPPTNKLYRNDGNWKFTDVSAKAGVDDTGYGLGVCAGDYDNDGNLDIYVNNFGPSVLYHNNGDGAFTDVTAKAGVGQDGCGAGCVFLDIEGDGDLDLYVALYLKFSLEESHPDFKDGVPFYRPPEKYDPVPDVLFRNNGDGTFTDISREAGITARCGWGMGIVAADYDGDGDADIFVSNDVSENFLWKNDGQGHFKEVALEMGTSCDWHGLEQGSMGVDCGDYDHDGHLDFYQTSYATQMPCTFRNLGGGKFAEVTVPCGSGMNQLARVTWGCNFGDFDNDGFADIFVATGHVQDLIDRITSTYHYKERNLIYHNDGHGRFSEIGTTSGPGFGVVESSRGSAVGDLDNDGDLDVVVLNARTSPTLLRNDTKNGSHWIQILTRGTKSNRAGIGAQVFLTLGGATTVAEVHGGRSYQSHYGLRLHFGLGQNPRADRIEVRWPSRTIDVLTDVEADRLLTITEGSSP